MAQRLDFMLTANGDTDEFQSSLVQLDGRTFQVKAVHRRWDDTWMGSLYTASGTAIIEGAVCNHGEDWLSNVVHPDRPPGKLMVVDTLGSHRDPGAQDFRSGVWLAYVPAA